MATETVHQSAASAAADSAREEPATPNESTGPDAPVEQLAAADSTQTAPSGDAASNSSLEGAAGKPPATHNESTGPDAPVEHPAAADSTQTAPSGDAASNSSSEAAPATS